VNVSAEAARRFLVARHFLSPARCLDGGRDAVLEVFRRFGTVQFDPLSVAGRNHDLVLHARVADYDPAWCERLYEQREVFEAYNKGLSLVPTSEFPWFRGSVRQQAAQVLAENAEVAEHVLERIRAEGPLSALDFERGPGGDPWGWEWGTTSDVRAVLDAYTLTGVLGLARRDGNRRYYDLLERLLPGELLAREVPLRQQLRHKLLSRYRANGLLGLGGGGDIWGGLGYARPNPKRPDLPGRYELHSELVENGELLPVEIEGMRGKRFILPEEAELIAAPPEPPPSVALLPPFDSFVWDRSFLRSLFDFDYPLELFHPAPKRRYGWYVLAILFRDRFVGRIEPRIDRDSGVVRVDGLWWEDGFVPRRADGFVDAMRAALRAYLGFAEAQRLQWAPHLGKEKRLFLNRP
jgi:uncharacterized protein YcaQ